jgi:glycosyltransferase involved in cell wall biosynthesis
MDPARLELDRKPWWYARIGLFALGRVSFWVATSPSLLEHWPIFIPRARCHTIANGAAVPPRLPVRTDERDARVCYLSSMEHGKGWGDLVAAAVQLCAEHPELEFHFYGPVGTDSTSTAVSSRFASSPYPERIVWHGPVSGDAKWRALVDSDLFCFPSHTEQFPLAILEAMICGLPIVATHVGAIQDAVVAGEGGWLVAPRAPEQLARAIREAFSDPTRLLRFGEFNRARQEQLFSFSEFESEWERFLARVAS